MQAALSISIHFHSALRDETDIGVRQEPASGFSYLPQTRKLLSLFSQPANFGKVIIEGKPIGIVLTITTLRGNVLKVFI
jgi:hypothetical protein